MRIAVFGDSLGANHLATVRGSIRWLLNRLGPSEVHTQVAPGLGLIVAEESLNLGFPLHLHQSCDGQGAGWPRPLLARCQQVHPYAARLDVYGDEDTRDTLLLAVTGAMQQVDALVLYRNLRGMRPCASGHRADMVAEDRNLPVLRMFDDRVTFDGTVWRFPNPNPGDFHAS